MRVVMSDIPSGFTRLQSTSPFHELVGPFYEKRDRATLIIGMPVAKKHINRRGAVHGGMHYINIRGNTGSISIKFESVPSPDNPKTSMLACYSAIAAVKALGSHVRYGT